jgi:hypothetical protein
MNREAGHALMTMADLRFGDHICCLYEGDNEHSAFLSSFLHKGLDRGERILYVTDARTPEAFLSLFNRKDRMRAERYLEDENLLILSAHDTYLRDGVFDPDKMISLLQSETEKSLMEGYEGLRVTSEMTWALNRQPGSQRLIEFESKLDAFLPGSKCMVMCQYDQRQFGPILLLYVMATHPIAVIGKEVYDNFYYMPPPEFLTRRGIPVTTLHHWLENLTIRKQAMASHYA